MNIKGFEHLKDISDFSLIRSEGQHSMCCLTLRVKEDDALSFVMNEGKAITLVNDNGSTLFYGIIQGVEVKRTYHNAFLTIKAYSFSILADRDAKIHIWQRSQRSLSEILMNLPWNEYKCKLDLGEAGNKKPLGLKVGQDETNAIIQSSETDFSFLRRLVRSNGYRLWIQDTISGSTSIKVGKKIAARELTGKDIVAITCKNINGQVCLTLRTQRDTELNLGDVVNFSGVKGVVGSYIVVKKTIKKKRGVLFVTYGLETETIKSYLLDDVTNIPMTLWGKVTDNNDPKKLGRIQVDFTANGIIDEDKGRESIWIPYYTPYGGDGGRCGIVFLPDKGDIVTVIVADMNIWAVNAVRKNILDEECENPDDKYLGNNHKQRIILHKDFLEILSFENKIFMDNSKIEFTMGNNQGKILMEKDKIVLLNKDNALELSSEGISLKTKKDITLNGNGKGSFDVSNTLKINGSEVDIG